MRALLLLFPLLLAAEGQNDPRLAPALDRVSEEAEAFANSAPKVIGQETLTQKARVVRRRLRLRVGKDALQPPPAEYKQREIISEYGFSHFKEAPDSLHELRKVVTVDGKPVTAREKARVSLTEGVTSDDDRLKKKLLMEFQKYGLADAAVDFGQLLLLFTRRNLTNYKFAIAGERDLSGEKALVLSYQQASGAGGLTVFEGKRALKEPLSGELWVRLEDHLPLRITLSTSTEDEKNHVTRHQGEVDYVRSGHGLLLPVSVRYERHVDNELMVENICHYSSFALFSVDAEIKFEPERSPAPR